MKSPIMIQWIIYLEQNDRKKQRLIPYT